MTNEASTTLSFTISSAQDASTVTQETVIQISRREDNPAGLEIFLKRSAKRALNKYRDEYSSRTTSRTNDEESIYLSQL